MAFSPGPGLGASVLGPQSIGLSPRVGVDPSQFDLWVQQRAMEEAQQIAEIQEQQAQRAKRVGLLGSLAGKGAKAGLETARPGIGSALSPRNAIMRLFGAAPSEGAAPLPRPFTDEAFLRAVGLPYQNRVQGYMDTGKNATEAAKAWFPSFHQQQDPATLLMGSGRTVIAQPIAQSGAQQGLQAGAATGAATGATSAKTISATETGSSVLGTAGNVMGGVLTGANTAKSIQQSGLKRAALPPGAEGEKARRAGVVEAGAGALSGAKTGAAIGSVFGPAGSAVGGVVGAVAGAIPGAKKALGKKVHKEEAPGYTWKWY